jgi:hypothetical protein
VRVDSPVTETQRDTKKRKEKRKAGKSEANGEESGQGIDAKTGDEQAQRGIESLQAETQCE